MDLPFNIWISFVSICLIISGIGLLLGFKRIQGAPFITIIGGILLFATTVFTSNIEGVLPNKVESTVANTTLYMNQQTSTGSTVLCGACTNTFFGEQAVNSQSELYQKEINYFQTRLDKDLVPTGDLYVGVWNGVVNPTSTNYKFLISQMHANETNLSQMDYTFIRNDSRTYRLQVDDVVGIFYNGGSSGNQINTYSNATTSTFDGTNSLQSRFQRTTNTWVDGASGADMRAKIGLLKTDIDTNYDKYAFNQNDLWAFMVFISFTIILIGAVFQKQDWQK